MSSISSIHSGPSWESIKEIALQNKNLNADIRVGDNAVQVNEPTIWQRFKVAIGWEKTRVYATREETLTNLREQFGIDFSRKLQSLVQDIGIKKDSEEYNLLVTHSMQLFNEITQKLTNSIATPTVSTSQAIQETHKGALTSFALLRQKFARPQRTPQFCKMKNGQWSVLQPAPHPENFVLSGGGVKGAGYVGWFKAAEQFGVLGNLKRIAGSSAGAITAAMIASGMNAEAFQQASNRISFWSLLTGTSSNPVIDAATKVETKGCLSYFSFSGTYAVDRINQEMLSSIKKYFDTFQTQTAFKQKIKEILINNNETSEVEKNQLVEKLINLYQKMIPQPRYRLFGSLFQRKQATYMVTFEDLAALAKIDTRFKELTVTGYAYEKKEERYFDAQKTPCLSIAEAVRGSMALPGAFNPVIINGEKIIDGGVASNTPTEVFKNFPTEKTLILQFENNGRFNQTVYDVSNNHNSEVINGLLQRTEDAVKEKIEEAMTGNPRLVKDEQDDEQKLYHAGPNAIMVAEGDLEVTDFKASPERIRQAQLQAQIRAEEAFSLRQDQGVAHVFNLLVEAMRKMTSAELKSITDFYGVTPPLYDPDYEKNEGRGDTLPLFTQDRRILPQLLSVEDRYDIVQAAKKELVARSQQECPL